MDEKTGVQGSEHSTQHSPNHSCCQACQQFRALSVITAEHPFNLASEIWLRTHSQYIKPSSLRVYEQHRKALAAFFEEIPLGKLHIGNIRAYQAERRGKVCPEMINAEIGSVLVPILAEVECWERFIRVYRPLPVPHKRVRQSMTDEEMRRLLVVALDYSKPRRILAGHCLLVMANTGTGFGELRHMHRDDVILNEQDPYIIVSDGLKTADRPRTIALNWIALRSMRWIVKRWEKLGGSLPDQYILPHMARKTAAQRQDRNHHRSEPIFDEPMLTIWNAARKILNEAGLEHLKIYDCRSHFATKIMEDPDVSESEAGEWIGHSKLAKEMNRRYFAPKMKKMVKAVEKIAVDPAPVNKLIVFSGGRK